MCQPQPKFSRPESSSCIVSTAQQRIEEAPSHEVGSEGHICIVKQCAGLFCTLDRFLTSFSFSFAILFQVRMISCPSPINRQLLIKRLQRVQFSGWSFLAGTLERSHDYAILYPHDPRLPWTTKYFHANLVEDVFDLGFSENWRMAMVVRTMMMWCGRMIIEHDEDEDDDNDYDDYLSPIWSVSCAPDYRTKCPLNKGRAGITMCRAPSQKVSRISLQHNAWYKKSVHCVRGIFVSYIYVQFFGGLGVVCF